ncbi:hypothetical protein T492DRAFT_580646, partial [Pavlovales sp. CCMP2436]
ELLQWVRSENCPWDYLTCINAALAGNLHVPVWAIDNGCEHEEQETALCGAAVHGLQLEVLQWARTNGYQWGGLMLSIA